MVLLYEKSSDELYNADLKELGRRLYKVIGMSSLVIQKKYCYGTLFLKHNQEARPSGELKAKSGGFKEEEEYRPVIQLYHSQLFALVEGDNFKITETGKIFFINNA